jgi:prophage antirepressor-like protein
MIGNSRKDVSSIDPPGGAQQMTIVDEFGLYSLILGSRKPRAMTF